MWFNRTVVMLLAALLVSCGRGPQRFSGTDWREYKDHFVSTDGRVIDTGNENISHSEGQGYGMLLAIAAGNRSDFDRIWNWTQSNLQLRDDHLFMWRRRPGVALADEDINNASDGDILIAWALLLAGKYWNVPEYQLSATAILSDIKTKLIRRWREHTILLPGADGFEKKFGYTVNLSHWIFPALTRFAEIDSSADWNALIESGEVLLEQARFGRWGLPPDWLELGAEVRVSTTKPPVFGYNAVRIPLYLIWGQRETSANLSPFLAFWSTYPSFIPAWTNLADDSIDSFPASDGIAAVANLVFYKSGRPAVRRGVSLAEQQDYYSASLILLSQIALYQVL